MNRSQRPRRLDGRGESMVALEVSVNGKVIYTMGVGERGTMGVEVAWCSIDGSSGNKFEECWAGGRGMAGPAGGGLIWPRVAISRGDVVTVRVIESDAVDAGSPLTGR